MIRQTIQRLYASTSLNRPLRVSSQQIYAAVTDPGKLRISGQQIYAAITEPNNLRATEYLLYSIQSVHRKIPFNRLDGGQIFGIQEWDIEYTTAIVPEINPYRPSVPDEFFDLGENFYYFSRENQEILRKQHNLTQAGDTTFPWQMLTEVHDVQQFTLGSTARFYHEDYGLIQARYVTFGFIDQNSNLTAPVGLINSHEALDWVVTNNYGLSSPHMVVGILASYVMPTNGQFGWAICDGFVPGEVSSENSNGLSAGDSFTWSSTGYVSRGDVGRIVGRRVGNQSDIRLTPGRFKVQIESWSEGDLTEKIQAALVGLTESLEELQQAVEFLEGSDFASQITSILSSLNSLTQRLTLEEQRRLAGDNALSNRIDNLNFVTAGQLTNATTALQNNIDQLESELTPQIASAAANAILALQQIAALVIPDLGPIYSTLTSLSTLVNEINDRLTIVEAEPYGILPVVDGSVPPNLVYLDDGSLVWVEVNP